MKYKNIHKKISFNWLLDNNIFKYLVFIISIFFLFNTNIFALSYVCSYKNGQDTIDLQISGKYGISTENDFTFSLNYHGKKSNFYPANYIYVDDSLNQTKNYAHYYLGYYSDKYYVYACPKKIYLPINNNYIKDISIYKTYGSNLGSKLDVKLGFFDEQAYKIDDSNIKITDEEVFIETLEELGIDKELMKSNYSTKTFELDVNKSNQKNNEENSNQEKPANEIDYNNKYCYYSNFCGETIALNFYNNSNKYNRLIYKTNNSKKIIQEGMFDAEYREKICPLAIKKEDYSFKYKAQDNCVSNEKNCYSYKEYTTNREDQKIVNGTCNQVADNLAVYTNINNNRKIYLKSLSGTGYGSMGDDFTIDNMDDFISKFQSGDISKYPHYIIYNSNDKTYNFSNTAVKNLDNYELENNKLPSLDYDFKATCENVFGKTFMTFLNDNVFKLIYIIVPIILIVLTSIDFAKVIFSDDKDGIKKATSRFVKRLIVSVLIYLTPLLFTTIAGLIGVDEIKECSEYLKKCIQSNDIKTCEEYLKKQKDN